MIEGLHGVVTRLEGDWAQTRVLVVGDVMLDRYIWGDVERISPEAPVPVVRLAQRSEQPGGAANVAMNIVGLGARATLCGFAGEDEESAALEACLAKAGMEARLTRVPGRPTTSKLRILGGQQQILRLDHEQTESLPEQAYAALLAEVRAALPGARAVVLSDYAKGVLSEEVCRVVIGGARAAGVPVLVDPKHRDFARYRGATVICPNLQEMSAACGIAPREAGAMLETARAMLPGLDLDCLAVTLGEKGIAVVEPGRTRTFPAVARQVFDVSGAGDTVVATLALALASGLPMEIAAPLANVAAGVVVSKVGTVPVTREELITSLLPEIGLRASEKQLELVQLQSRMAAWRSRGERVVFTNGCFDLLHVGHIMLLEAARQEGDRLIVAINSDASVSALKGPSRPVVRERDRGRVLAALAVVDAVIVFDEPTPLELIRALRPDVIVKGGDYIEEMVVGAKEVRGWGGVVKIVPTLEGFSTTRMITRAQAPALR